MFMDQGEKLHQVTEEDYLLNKLRVNTGGEGREVTGQQDLALGISKHTFRWKQTCFELHSWGNDEEITGCL